MTKGWLAGLLSAVLLTACAPKESNITLIGLVESVYENGIMVTTTDSVGFDKASVSYDKGYTPDFTPQAGDQVEVTILPEIRESYPVQVTAVKLKLVEKEKETSQTMNANYQRITPQQAKEIMDTNSDAIILDVRTKEEFELGFIENAILIPDTQLKQLAPEKLPDKDATILVYCRSGRRSENSSRQLIAMGYTNVLDFGGIIDWDYEIVTN